LVGSGTARTTTSKSKATPAAAVAKKPVDKKKPLVKKRKLSKPDTGIKKRSPTVPAPTVVADPPLSLHKQAREYVAMYSGNPNGPFPVDKNVLCKQKTKSYPRDRVHYYNKVVTLVDDDNKSTNQSPVTYYFVLDFDEPKGEVMLIPMAVTGTLSGKRAGRPRYQCLVEADSSNWKVAVRTSDCAIVSGAVMVMKTPLISQEAWDVTDPSK
jgi:hypothetical protein